MPRSPLPTQGPLLAFHRCSLLRLPLRRSLLRLPCRRPRKLFIATRTRTRTVPTRCSQQIRDFDRVSTDSFLLVTEQSSRAPKLSIFKLEWVLFIWSNKMVIKFYNYNRYHSNDYIKYKLIGYLLNRITG